MAFSKGGSEYEIRIQPDASWWRIDFLGLWQFRDLLVLLIRRDFVSKYSQTLLGPLWFVFQPLVTTLLFTVVFAGVAKISTNSSPALLFYLSGMLPWNYLANTFGSCATSLTANAGLFGKVFFPRLIVPISGAVSNLFAFAIHLGLIFLAFGMYRLLRPEQSPELSWRVCLMPFAIVQLAALAIGSGLWMSALTTKYRDFTHVSGFLVNVWFYATPVVFPLSIVPPHLRAFAMLNPMTFIEELFRYVLLGEGLIIPAFAFMSIGMTAVLFVTGVLAFQRCERTFVDSV